jgi:hypothetical protein
VNEWICLGLAWLAPVALILWDVRDRNIQHSVDLSLLLNFAIAVGAIGAAAIAWLAFNDAQVQARRQYRAYIFYNENAIELLPADAKYRVTMTLKNRGQTTAYSVTYWWAARVLPVVGGPRRQYDVAFKETGRASFDIDPQGEWPIDSLEEPVSAAELEAVREGTKAVYIWGVVKYRDAFMRCQLVNFLVRGGPEARSSFRALEVNNTTETPCDTLGENGVYKATFP